MTVKYLTAIFFPRARLVLLFLFILLALNPGAVYATCATMGAATTMICNTGEVYAGRKCLADGSWQEGAGGPDTCNQTQYSYEQSQLWQMQPYPEWEDNAISREGSEAWYLYGVGSFMGGIATNIAPSKAIQDKALTMGKPVPQGAINYLSTAIHTMTTNRPAKTAVYLADLGKQAGIYNPVYAQSEGTGFAALQPILSLWKVFRNMAYLAFVVIFVIIGFMIMFRSKVSQQAVISIQLALPQIVITLLLITFSYAIASLMIDLVYFLIYLIIAMFSAFGVISKEETVQKIMMEEGWFAIWWHYMASPNDMAGRAADAVSQLLDSNLLGVIGRVVSGLGISNVLAYLIFAIAMLISMFKLFFQLLMSYVGLVVSTIFSPILILFNAMPGSQSFSKWLKGIFANAIIFPVVALMIIVSAVLVGQGEFGINPDIKYQGRFGNQNELALPFVVAGFSADTVKALLAIGILMMLPKVVERVQKALGVEGGIAGMVGSIAEPLKQGFAGVSYIPSKVGGAWGQAGYAREAEIGRIRREGALRGSSPTQISDAEKQVPGRWDSFTNILRNRKG